MRGLLVALVVAACGGGNAGVGPDGGNSDDGSGGDAPPSCPPGQWCTEASPVAGVLLHAVDAATADDVFAVGDGGTILYRHANAWTQQASNVTANLRGVGGTSASDVWAVGVEGTLVHYDGAAWTAVTGVTTADLEAVYAPSATDVWVAGGQELEHLVGTTWSSVPLAGVQLAISGIASNDIWVTGENAAVHHYDGASWGSLIKPTNTSNYFAIAQVAATDVWVTDALEALRFDGSKWTKTATPGHIMQSLFAKAADDVWSTAGASVGHFDGGAWTFETPPGVTMQLWAVGGVGPHVWVVGDAATILHRD